jgi:hypothetical protein
MRCDSRRSLMRGDSGGSTRVACLGDTSNKTQSKIAILSTPRTTKAAISIRILRSTMTRSSSMVHRNTLYLA